MSKHNLSVYTLMTAPMSGKEAELSETDLRISAATGIQAVNDYLRGLAAIGNITSWACENPNYTDHVHDLPALADFLKHTAQMARATSFFTSHAEYMADVHEHKQQGGQRNAE